jgi:hypothetical protein
MTLRLHNSTYTNENLLIESLISEAINIYGIDFLYIPRQFVNKDEILGEDRLSKFPNAYPVIMYMENTEGGFIGQGAFASKFGLTMEQSATLTVSRRNWQASVAKYGTTVLPNRPAEGDLLYFPMTKGLFEINFVQHQEPFYQLGQLYVYRLTVELFRYASEKLETGIEAIDSFNDLATSGGSDVEKPQSYGDNEKFRNRAKDFVFNVQNPFGDAF